MPTLNNTVDASSVLAGLRSRLMARQIHYNVYTFKNGDVVISTTVRGFRMTMQMMYQIKVVDSDKFEISGYGWSKIVRGENEAISNIVKDIRKYEMRFNKYLN
jgi:hypothetical protein